MQKKGYMVWGNIAKGILVLIVLGLSLKIVIDLTGNPVQYLLGFGNISKFDKDIAERYNITRELNKDAIASINGLLYGINSVAVFDTARTPERDEGILEKLGIKKEEDLEKYKKEFGNVKIEPTYYDMRTIYLKGDKDNVMRTMTKALFDCQDIFSDKANENTRCFLVKVDSNVDLNWFNDFETYFKNVNCDGICKDAQRIEKCKSKCENLKYDLSGSYSWNPFSSFFGVFNSKNYEYGITPELILKNDREFRICGSNALVNEIHFSIKDDYCKTPKEEVAFGYVVENFALPQTVEKSESIFVYGVEQWLSAYGDPQYILFYEKFPKEEAEYWKASAYNVAFLTILGTEVAFLGVDLITIGLATPLKALYTRLGGTVVGKSVGAIKNAVKGAISKTLGRALRWVWSRTGAKAINAILRKQLTKEVLEESAEKTIRNTLKKSLKKETFAQLDDDAFKLLKNKYLEALDEIGESAFKDGKITKEGLEQLENEFGRVMKGTFRDSAEDRVIMNSLKGAMEEQYDITIYKISKELSEEVSRAGLRAIPRTMISAYKSANRARNLLKEMFLGDMTDKKRMEVLMSAMDDWEKTFRAMKPHELRTFIANQKDATLMLDKMIEGKIGDVAEKAAAKELRDNMDNFLTKVVNERGDLGKMFKTSVEIQKLSAPIAKRPRHLVALMAGYYSTKIESMQAKFYSVGTNAIGLKVPYAPPVVYDDEFSESIKNLDKEKKFLEDYTEGRNVGLLPVANRYFISLTKDRFSWWFDQEPQRFHLVSPCYADIFLTVSNCDCKGSEDPEAGLYWTGKEYDIYGEDEDGNKIIAGETYFPHFDEKNPVLYRLDENGEPIKECYAGKLLRWDTSYTTKCIKVNPILDTYKDFEYNYCYHGKDPLYEIGRATATALEVGVPIVGGLLCGLAAPACMAGLAAISFGVSASIEMGKAALDIQHQWPNHR